MECSGGADSQSSAGVQTTHTPSHCTHCAAKPFTHLLASQTYIPSHGLRHTPARSLIQNLVKSVFRPPLSLELLTDIKETQRVIEGDQYRCLTTVQASNQFDTRVSSHPMPMRRRETRVCQAGKK